METQKTVGFSTGSGPLDMITMSEHLEQMKNGFNERNAMQRHIDCLGKELILETTRYVEIKKVLKEYLTFKSIDGRVERQKLRETLKSFI